MDSHQLSKITTAARTPPVVPGANVWKTLDYSTEEEKQDFEKLPDYGNEDILESNQLEPDNFKPITNVERSNLHSFSLDRDSLNAQFLQKIQALKKEHQKTLTLLNQFYESEKSESHGNIRRNINHLAPDYLDYTENNTLYHGNVPDRSPDVIPGYTKPYSPVKFCDENSEETKDTDEDAELSSNADSIELINHMWDNFSLDEYMGGGNRRPQRKRVKQSVSAHSAPAKKKEWKPVITIPKPFNMTLRDEQKRDKMHTRSSMEVSIREQMRADAEEAERSKKIRAREPPSHIYLPLYEEMCERREQRSRFNKETSMATTVAMQKPFSFAERDEKRLEQKKSRLKEDEEKKLNLIKRRCMFEAQPIPLCVYDSSAEDQRLEDALYRKIKAKLRSEDLMRTSQYPPRMRSHERLARKRREVWTREIEEATNPTFKPKLSSMPDFDLLHRHGEMWAMTKYPPPETTLVKPFKFHSTVRKSRSLDRNSLEPSWGPTRSPPAHQPGKMPVFSDTLPTRMSDSARVRLDNMQRSLQEADYALKKEENEEKERKQRKKVLSMKVQERAALNDPSASLTASNKERQRQYKKELRQQQSNYNKFLKDVKRKVDERPLLFEQHDEKVAKQQAERRYRQILESSGLSDDFVMNKSMKASSEDFETSSPRDFELTNRSRIVVSDGEDSGAEKAATGRKIVVMESPNSSDDNSRENFNKEKHVQFG